MAKHFLLYISAARDLESEREVLARSAIAIPADVTWRIEQSPRGNEVVDSQAIAQADSHLLLLAGDIRAPIGLEWITARRFGRLPLPYLKDGANRTLAAEEFRRFVELQTTWLPFTGSAELGRSVQQLLGKQILDAAPVYGLSAGEAVQLGAWLAELEKTPLQIDDVLGGAGESSLVFSKEHYEPSTGVLLRPGQTDDDSHAR